MATITLTISDELLTRLKAGETTLALTATLRERKPRKSEPLPEHLREAHRFVVDEWTLFQPDVSPALAWKAVKPLLDDYGDGVLRGMALALDWNQGRKYLPVWYVREWAEWQNRLALDLFTQDEERTRYRQRFGLR